MTKIRIDRARVTRMLREKGGLVERDLRRRARLVVNEARRLAPGSMPSRITEPSISDRGRGPSASIESRHPATLYVVNGTRPHQIRPVRAKALRFTVGGRVVFARLVNHPGTKPNDFLGAALRKAL